MGLLDILGFGNKNEQIQEFINRNAVIIDVRSPLEYSSGHVKGSQNIPLNSIKHKIDKVKKLNKPIITCCASGIRSGSAANTLKQNGIETMNGGSWTNVNSLIG